METDSLFYQLFQQLPETLFELLDLPAKRAKSYRFESVELKKAFRIDGLFLPKKAMLPIYFVEFQFQRVQTFYANLFAKVFCYLEQNDPKHEWVAVAIFPTRKEEPKHLGPYEDLLNSKRVKRIYLAELAAIKDPPIGLGVLQMLFAGRRELQELAPHLVEQASEEIADSDLQIKVVELMERMLLSRFPEYDREEMLMKFKLHDIRESKIWKEAHTLGREDERRERVHALAAKGMAASQIAELLNLSEKQVGKFMDESAAIESEEK
jgi:predicted transposase/invertase (TIGR01784 family)